MEAVLAFMPEEEREKYSALTGMSLFYFSDGKSLKHKILAIVEEEGAERATYALKLLQSEGELTIASTGKDPQTGRLVTQEYRVEGPVMIFLTTTAITIDEELLNRCLILTVDENREQTRAIHQLQRQRETIEGLLLEREKQQIERLHRNAQRLLRPLLVANPFAERLTFLDDRTRTRRDHVKYLTLIRTIALLHQYQRPIKRITRPASTNGSLSATGGEAKTVEYIEATLEDIATANRLAAEVLGRSLDELPPQTRRFLMTLEAMVERACRKSGIVRSDLRFTGRDVREATGFTHEQVRVHIGRLVELEYVLVHRGGRGQSFVYELLYDGQGKDGRPFLMGLIDAGDLAPAAAPAAADIVPPLGPISTTSSVGGETGGCGVSLGGHWGGVGVPLVGQEMASKSALQAASSDLIPETRDNSLLGATEKSQPYTYTQPSPNGNGRLHLRRVGGL
jgi:DNA primase